MHLSARKRRSPRETGTISAAIRIRAFTVDGAQEVALRVFTAALGLAGFRSDPGWLYIEALGPYASA